MDRKQPNIRPSLLDRLIDSEPGIGREPAQSRLTTIGQVRASVTRDLEKLLNTKGTIMTPPPSYSELDHSLFTYGLSDFTSSSPKSQSLRQRLHQEIERKISRFEPRLRNIAVRLETSVQTERNLRFKIVGLLVIDPVTEPVTFDTYFDINKGEYIIEK
jgi:type VI secretion system protein ImpF